MGGLHDVGVADVPVHVEQERQPADRVQHACLRMEEDGAPGLEKAAIAKARGEKGGDRLRIGKVLQDLTAVQGPIVGDVDGRSRSTCTRVRSQRGFGRQSASITAIRSPLDRWTPKSFNLADWVCSVNTTRMCGTIRRSLSGTSVVLSAEPTVLHHDQLERLVEVLGGEGLQHLDVVMPGLLIGQLEVRDDDHGDCGLHGNQLTDNWGDLPTHFFLAFRRSAPAAGCAGAGVSRLAAVPGVASVVPQLLMQSMSKRLRG
jgi:hypothetical protein